MGPPIERWCQVSVEMGPPIERRCQVSNPLIKRNPPKFINVRPAEECPFWSTEIGRKRQPCPPLLVENTRNGKKHAEKQSGDPTKTLDTPVVPFMVIYCLTSLVTDLPPKVTSIVRLYPPAFGQKTWKLHEDMLYLVGETATWCQYSEFHCLCASGKRKYHRYLEQKYMHWQLKTKPSNMTICSK